ncbi:MULTISPECIES: glycoside hydrolase [Microbacterium]|uniref:glycoside hydrolase n=1 Tax=Microbacterium TaxID=33882 RepID=UPI00146B9C32|nr:MULTISPECIES: glycoside hydrolase [Microbacterium]
MIDLAQSVNAPFRGWGTSLAWMGRGLEGWEEPARRQAIAHVFGADGLGLNIVRYNIGGGDAPGHDHMPHERALEGFLKHDGTWDWSADRGQRSILRDALAAGVDYVEAFSNSAPYWMTASGCVSGAEHGGPNLPDANVREFAHYLAAVVRHLIDVDQIPVRSLNPVNEPSAYTWIAGGHQEGCRVSRPQLIEILRETRMALDRAGINRVALVGPDETSVDETIETAREVFLAAPDLLKRVNTHVYGWGNRRELARLSSEWAVPLWMSEYGVGSGPHDHDDIRSAIELARMIMRDLNELQPEAWIYWQAIESERECVERNDNGGLIHADFASQKLYLTRHYWVMRAFTHAVPPGSRYSVVPDEPVLVAEQPTGRRSALLVNDTLRPRVHFIDKVENWELHQSDIVDVGNCGDPWGAIALSNARYSVTVPPQAIVTMTFLPTADGGPSRQMTEPDRC